MKRVFKSQLTEKQYQHLSKAFYSHLVLMMKDFFFLLLKKNNIDEQIALRGVEHLHQALTKGKGVILLTGHFGNWELTKLADLPKIHEIPKNDIYVIRRKQAPLLQKILDYLYKPTKLTRIEQKGSIRSACNALKNNGVLIFPFDHRATQDESHSIDVEFFGIKASCFRSLALIAKCTGAVILPLNHHRAHSKQAILEYYPAITWINNSDKEQEIYQNTLQYNKILEQFILQHPEQWWCWAYKRWKKKY